ncbi:MAG: threonylcarbamoyl-AMP synthase [Candidatus Magasanikbacteria bacterium]|nr:threonylcarbamoyl-AMP synthase [Candidatus Magasanikbacteria bacterium]
MKIIKEKDISIKEIVKALQSGKVIVYPTETSYGFGVDATNKEAVNKIFKIKQRQKGKPVLVVMPNIHMAMEYVEWSEKLDELAQKYWPGPLTVVVPTKNNHNLASGVVAGDNTLAFRISSHPLVAELTQKLGKPIVSTSANLASQNDPYDAQEIISIFEKEENKPDIIIDAGELPEESPSTIIRLLNGELEVLRQGQVKMNR